MNGRFLSQPWACPDVGDAVLKGLLRLLCCVLLISVGEERRASVSSSLFDSGTDPAPQSSPHFPSQLTPDGNLILGSFRQAAWLFACLFVCLFVCLVWRRLRSPQLCCHPSPFARMFTV